MFNLFRAASKLYATTPRLLPSFGLLPLPRCLTLETYRKLPRKWTNQDEQTLVTLFSAGTTYHEIADQLQRTFIAVRSRIKLLRRKGMELEPRASRAWSPEENSILLQALHDKKPFARINELLPSRSQRSLESRFYNKDRQLGDALACSRPRVPFTREDDARFLHLQRHEGMTLAQIALLMSRSRSSVGARSCALSQIQTPPFAVNVARELAELKKTGRLPENFHSLSKKHRQWASKEKSQVLAMANAGFSTRDIAASLNRSIRAVQLCARNARRADPAKLRCRARLPWTEEEASKLLDMKASGSTAKQIAHALSRSASSVDSKLYHMTRREAHPPKMKEEVRSD